MKKTESDLVALAVAARLYIEASVNVFDVSNEGHAKVDDDDLKKLIAENKTAYVLFRAVSARVNMTLIDDTVQGLGHKYKEELRRAIDKLNRHTEERLKKGAKKDGTPD